MSLRRRLTLLSALAVALAVAVTSVIVYVLVRDRLRGQIDDTLRERSDVATVFVDGRGFHPGEAPPEIAVPGPPGSGAPHTVPLPGPGAGPAPAAAQPGDVLELPPPPRGEFVARGQLIDSNGEVHVPPEMPGGAGPAGTDLSIPVSDEAKQVAAGSRGEFFADVKAGGAELRVLTVPAAPDTALQVARPLTEVNDTLDELTLILIAISGGGIALGAGMGLLVARTSLAPAGTVADAAREVAETKDLTRRIQVHGGDELGSLAASFNEMLAALESSVGAQRRLVADASHELRTPLATLRTNIDTLQRRGQLSPEERRRVLSDLSAEMEELSSLVGDVVELAREPSEDAAVRQDVRLDEVTAAGAERARRRARGLRFETELEPAVVSGDPARLERAVSNLLDNAIKWSPEGGVVEITQAGGRVAVRDHGPGFGEQDLARAFERFYRADEARGMPGSGLGLAIVQRIVSQHGGTVGAANAPGGGARVEISLPLADS